MSELYDAIVDMDEDKAITLAKKQLADGVDPVKVLDDCKEALTTVGKLFEEGKYYVPELVLAGDIMAAISAEARPLINKQDNKAKRGKVVIGTVEGDIHDVGKDIVSMMLEVNGFEVYDLGIDVPAQVFVDKVREVKPQVLALSGFLTLAFNSMKATVEAIEAAGLRDGLMIMVGGGTVDDNVRIFAKADGYGFEAMTAVKLARQWTEA